MRQLLRRQWPVFFWAAVIWIFSTQWFAEDNTSRLIVPILKWILPGAAPATIAFLHYLIRKSAHFIEYFIFSLLVLRGIRGNRREWRIGWALAAAGVAAAYAATDEFHQSLVPGRFASFWDVLLDSSGVVAAQIVAWLFALRRREFENVTAGAGQRGRGAVQDPPGKGDEEDARTHL
jgi:VanZ family protein